MPPSDSSKARDDVRSAETGASKPGSSGAPGAPLDEADEAAALLKELTVGAIVDGKYRIDEVLGRGAMGVVVAATHLQLGERVALKFLRYRARGVNDDFQSRFKREARVSARLKNEHITRVIDVGVWRDQVPYMVMDYLTGSDLRQLVKKNGPLPVAQAIDFTVQICVGIAEAHAAGIVHRDLKPSNLFITRRPDGSGPHQDPRLRDLEVERRGVRRSRSSRRPAWSSARRSTWLPSEHFSSARPKVDSRS